VGVHRADLIVEKEIIVELKAVSEINNIHEAQIISYLKASGLRIGLIINFAKKRIDVTRKVLEYEDL
jgi:GxxExxY protein